MVAPEYCPLRVTKDSALARITPVAGAMVTVPRPYLAMSILCPIANGTVAFVGIVIVLAEAEFIMIN
jgi:hypothetical protein